MPLQLPPGIPDWACKGVAGETMPHYNEDIGYGTADRLRAHADRMDRLGAWRDRVTELESLAISGDAASAKHDDRSNPMSADLRNSALFCRSLSTHVEQTSKDV